jgi:hypothetical protein
MAGIKLMKYFARRATTATGTPRRVEGQLIELGQTGTDETG